MKKKLQVYESTEIEILRFNEVDIITSSGWEFGGGSNSDPNGWT